MTDNAQHLGPIEGALELGGVAIQFSMSGDFTARPSHADGAKQFLLEVVQAHLMNALAVIALKGAASKRPEKETAEQMTIRREHVPFLQAYFRDLSVAADTIKRMVGMLLADGPQVIVPGAAAARRILDHDGRGANGTA